MLEARQRSCSAGLGKSKFHARMKVQLYAIMNGVQITSAATSVTGKLSLGIRLYGFVVTGRVKRRWMGIRVLRMTSMP